MLYSIPLHHHPLFGQVVPDYRSGEMLLREQGREEEAQGAIVERRKRQRAWMKKEGSGWRPCKRHRVAAHEWIQATNSSLIVSGGRPEGWKAFQVSENMEERGDPMKWPVISGAFDRASDGRCALSYLGRVLRINVDPMGDPSHDLNNDMD